MLIYTHSDRDTHCKGWGEGRDLAPDPDPLSSPPPDLQLARLASLHAPLALLGDSGGGNVGGLTP